MQPFLTAEHVKDAYRRYVQTSFPIRWAELRARFERLIEEENLLWQDPFVSLSRPFEKGRDAGRARLRGRSRRRRPRRPVGLRGPLLPPGRRRPAARDAPGTGAEHDRGHGHRLGQDRVVPHPDRRRLPAQPGAGRRARGDPVPDERAGERSAQAPARAARGDGHHLRPVHRGHTPRRADEPGGEALPAAPGRGARRGALLPEGDPG